MIDARIKKMFPTISEALDNPVVREFAEVAQKYVELQERLGEVLGRCQNQGFFPGPVDTLRFRLPTNRSGMSHEASLICEDERLQLYIRPGTFADGRLGEVFLNVEHQGSFTSGMIDAFSIVLSLALQYGVPLEKVLDKLENTRFGKISVVGPSRIRRPTSVIDYIARWLRVQYGTSQESGSTDGEAGTTP